MPQESGDTNPHDDVIKWKHFPRYWPFVRGIQRSPVNSPNKGQWRGALVFTLICVRINGWVNNREAGDLRRHRAHYDVIVMPNFGFMPNTPNTGLSTFGTCDKPLRDASPESMTTQFIWSISQIPQCIIQISHKAPLYGALWDIGLVHCGVYAQSLGTVRCGHAPFILFILLPIYRALYTRLRGQAENQTGTSYISTKWLWVYATGLLTHVRWIPHTKASDADRSFDVFFDLRLNEWLNK